MTAPPPHTLLRIAQLASLDTQAPGKKIYSLRSKGSCKSSLGAATVLPHFPSLGEQRIRSRAAQPPAYGVPNFHALHLQCLRLPTVELHFVDPRVAEGRCAELLARG